ncbi:nuclease-related domain-containing protein [Gracilibacillus sp. YIM 98692]|uniref:nuclease-related domain-containing protein n=1 Tax=Gracilibacillus sp. YIM 98692 TaxID=2663532 RepID=UPI00196A1AA6|nr:nuclease-related domain-containing protein [Gracilibacillus sp. YIM 98692]
MIPVIPLIYQKYAALCNRLLEHHASFSVIDDYYHRYASGFQGEKSLDYYLEIVQDPYANWLKGLRLQYRHHFQIDRLYITPAFMLLMEAKNITGTIYFDPHSRQLYRKIENKEKVFSDPLLQVDLQAKQLRQVLTSANLPLMPMYTISVFTNPNAKLLLKDYQDRNRILTKQEIPFYIELLMANHQTPQLSIDQWQSVMQYLIDHHEEADIDILKKFQILWQDLLKGVRCPACSRLYMNRVRLSWQCPYCEHRSRDAHIPALIELALLSNNLISNKLAREFLMVDSADAVNKMLVRAGLHKIGANKNARYQFELSRLTDKSIKVTDKRAILTDK